MTKVIGTQWINTNPTRVGFRIVQTGQGFEIEQTSDNGVQWKYIATADDIFEAVLFAVRKTEEAYAAHLRTQG